MSAADVTNPTIFLRLRAEDTRPREFAWKEFHAKYAPIIAAFARRTGGKTADVDDVVQDVLMGFFSKSPTFVYDPSQGRFRGYLKVCTYRAVQKRFGKNARMNGQPLDQVDPQALAVEQAWNDVWEQQNLRQALEDVRSEMGSSRTFQAFEMYVVKDQPAQAVAEKLAMHINSVYRAKEQITRLVQEKVMKLNDDA